MSLTVKILYTNWRGETRERSIDPHKLFWGHDTYHQEDQWLLWAMDIEKGEMRTFAMKDIQSWRPSDAN